MITSDLEPKWQTAAILIGRLIFAGAFLMAAVFKYAGMEATGTISKLQVFLFPIFSPGSPPFLNVCWYFAFSPAPSFQKPA